MQIWKDIEGYKGHYQISNYGNVRSLKKDAFLMKGGYLKGYKIINLWKNGAGKMFRVHRLVAAAFIPNPKNKPCVDHIDGVRFHNFVENLRWCSINENNNFDIAIRNKTKYDFPIEGIDENGNVCIEFQNYKDAHKKGYYRHLIKQSVDTGKPYKGIIYRKK